MYDGLSAFDGSSVSFNTSVPQLERLSGEYLYLEKPHICAEPSRARGPLCPEPGPGPLEPPSATLAFAKTSLMPLLVYLHLDLSGCELSRNVQPGDWYG
jgi:hypothetical protein